MNVDSTNSSEENDSKTSDHELEVWVGGTKDVVGYYDRDNDDVANDGSVGDQGSINARQSKLAKGKPQN